MIQTKITDNGRNDDIHVESFNDKRIIRTYTPECYAQT